MSSERARLALRVLLTALGAVAVAVGILDVLVGPRSLIDGAEVPASVDSEYRFAHALWIGYGIAALWVARRAEHERTLVRGLALVLLLGGVARGIAWIDSGQPHPFFIGLLGLELLIPALIVFLQSRLSDDVNSPPL